jgi:hypothetical protein
MPAKILIKKSVRSVFLPIPAFLKKGIMEMRKKKKIR